jgi:hypothetical protein
MGDKHRVRHIETEIRAEFLAEIDMLRQSLECSPEALIEKLLREDMEWGLRGQD